MTIKFAHHNQFSNGRLFATVAAHGGLTDLSYWGSQHLGAAHFFRGAPISAWNKLFRVAIVLGEKRYYPVLHETQLFPFGLRGKGEVEGIPFQYDLLLLPDALVQRVEFLGDHGNQTIGLEILHQEAITAVQIAGRTWSDLAFHPESNALAASGVGNARRTRFKFTAVVRKAEKKRLAMRSMVGTRSWIPPAGPATIAMQGTGCATFRSPRSYIWSRRRRITGLSHGRTMGAGACLPGCILKGSACATPIAAGSTWSLPTATESCCRVRCPHMGLSWEGRRPPFGSSRRPPFPTGCIGWPIDADLSTNK